MRSDNVIITRPAWIYITLTKHWLEVRPTPAAKQAMAHIDEDYYNATMTKAKRDADRIKEKIAEQEKL